MPKTSHASRMGRRDVCLARLPENASVSLPDQDLALNPAISLTKTNVGERRRTVRGQFSFGNSGVHLTEIRLYHLGFIGKKTADSGLHGRALALRHFAAPLAARRYPGPLYACAPRAACALLSPAAACTGPGDASTCGTFLIFALTYACPASLDTGVGVGGHARARKHRRGAQNFVRSPAPRSSRSCASSASVRTP
jgi:hypothetical protein